MEESLTTKEMLEAKIRECIEGLKYVEQGSEQHQSLTADIQRLVNAYAELEKVENAKVDSDRKFAEEIRSKDQELHYKDCLERDRMRETRKSYLVDAIIKIFGIILPLGLHAVFLFLGLKLEFLDNGSICSFTVKELFRKGFSPKIG